MAVCPHQYKHISSDKFLCHNNEGRSYGPAKVPKGPPDTLFLANFKQKMAIYSSKFKFSFNFWKIYDLLAITILGSVVKFLQQEQPQLVLQRWYKGVQLSQKWFHLWAKILISCGLPMLSHIQSIQILMGSTVQIHVHPNIAIHHPSFTGIPHRVTYLATPTIVAQQAKVFAVWWTV